MRPYTAKEKETAFRLLSQILACRIDARAHGDGLAVWVDKIRETMMVRGWSAVAAGMAIANGFVRNVEADEYVRSFGVRCAFAAIGEIHDKATGQVLLRECLEAIS